MQGKKKNKETNGVTGTEIDVSHVLYANDDRKLDMNISFSRV